MKNIWKYIQDLYKKYIQDYINRFLTLLSAAAVGWVEVGLALPEPFPEFLSFVPSPIVQG